MKKSSLVLFFVLFTTFSCQEKTADKKESVETNQIPDKEIVLATMQKHLDAISERDLQTLQSTLSPEGTMQLILPGTEIIEKTSGFVDYHREWFKTDNWTMDSKILNLESGETLASAVVESIYKETERDGKPYFNRMHVSYVLKKVGDKWYVIKDHMASVEKSTDAQ